MNRRAEAVNFILILLKCFLVLLVFGTFLPSLIDYVLYYMYKSNYYDNSIFVNDIVDKNGKIIYNYIYIIKMILGIRAA